MITSIKEWKLYECGMINSKIKFYHSSGSKLKFGDTIGGPGKIVWMTDSPIPHPTIWDSVKNKFSNYNDYSKYSTSKEIIAKWNEYWDKRAKEQGEKMDPPSLMNPEPIEIYVWEVFPYEKPMFIRSNDEYRIDDNFVEIGNKVGNANSILNNFLNKFGDNAKAYHFAKSKVRNK